MISRSDVIGWNCRGLFAQNRLTSLQLFVHAHRPLAVCVFEARIDPSKPVPTLQGYNAVAKPVSARSAGLITFVRKDFQGRIACTPRPELEHSEHALVVELKLPARADPFLLVNAYHHRIGTTRSDQWTGLKRTLDACAAAGLSILCVADLNARHSDWDASTTDPFGTDFSDFCDERSFVVLNSVCCPGVATFPSSGSTLDLAVCSDVNLFTSVRVLDDSGLISDHHPIAVSVSVALPTFTTSTPPQPRPDYSRADWEAFSRYLSGVSSAADVRCRFESARHQRHPQTAINNVNSLIVKLLAQASEHAIPVVRRSNAPQHWADPAVKRAYERMRNANRARKSGLPDSKQQWNSARSAYNRVVNETKQRLWNERCERVFDPVKRQINWGLFNAATGEQRQEIGPIAKDGQKPATSLFESLNRLGAHYEAVSASPQSRSADDDEILKFVYTRQHDERGPVAMDDPFVLDKLNSVLTGLVHKATGPDGISNLLLKHSPPEFRAVLLYLFNYSWQHGVLPDGWRHASVCALYKGSPNSKAHPKSYRPISLTSCLAKVFEKMVLERLAAYLDEKRFFTTYQSGFRRHHNTLDLLYMLISRVQDSFRHRDYVSVAFLDIVAAFDSVWHEGLLFKLHKAGITGCAWRWIRAFLSGRKFRVVADGIQSDWFDVGAGVPQGSILGPFLFLIFINDVPVFFGVVVVLFADDIAVWPKLDGKAGDIVLNKALYAIFEWADRWQVTFSPTKSASMCFSNKRTQPIPLPIWLGDQLLPRVEQFRYLGLQLTPRLKWDAQCAAVCKSARHAAYRVSRVITKTGPSPKIVRLLVNTLVVPVITYGWPLWRPPTEKFWSKLDSVVCFPLRCAVGLPVSAQKLGLFVEFGVVCPKLWRECSALSFAHHVDCELGKVRPDHPAHKLFIEQSRAPLPKRCPKRYIPLAKSTVAYAYRFEVDHTDSRAAKIASMRKRALERQINWLKETRGKRKPTRYAREFTQCPAPTSYILTDTRQIATLRARIRLNRHHLRSRQHTLDPTVDNRCQHCLALNNQPALLVPSETPQHVLFECPLHDQPRWLWSIKLARSRIPFNMNILTGDYSEIGPEKRSLARAFTSSLLRDINENVPF
jgi:Reverse transcriptase (RNA-dependent DNA polymerase)/Endonuclease-reverse transcriptase